MFFSEVIVLPAFRQFTWIFTHNLPDYFTGTEAYCSRPNEVRVGIFVHLKHDCILKINLLYANRYMGCLLIVKKSPPQ